MRVVAGHSMSSIPAAFSGAPLQPTMAPLVSNGAHLVNGMNPVNPRNHYAPLHPTRRPRRGGSLRSQRSVSSPGITHFAPVPLALGGSPPAQTFNPIVPTVSRVERLPMVNEVTPMNAVKQMTKYGTAPRANINCA